jgi:aromatic-L-amino-acid decarboxylase
MGYELIGPISKFFDGISEKPVTASKSSKELQSVLGDSPLLKQGMPAGQLLASTSKLVFDNSLFNGHPKFFGFISSAAAPIRALADLLATSVNQNVGEQILRPRATEIDKQMTKSLSNLLELHQAMEVF